MLEGAHLSQIPKDGFVGARRTETTSRALEEGANADKRWKWFMDYKSRSIGTVDRSKQHLSVSFPSSVPLAHGPHATRRQPHIPLAGRWPSSVVLAENRLCPG